MTSLVPLRAAVRTLFTRLVDGFVSLERRSLPDVTAPTVYGGCDAIDYWLQEIDGVYPLY